MTTVSNFIAPRETDYGHPPVGAGWCRRCLADRDDPACCTPARLARLVSVRAKACGCLAGDICHCPWWG